MPFVWNVGAWGPRNHIMGIPQRERIVGGLYFGIPRLVCSRYCQSYSLHAVFEISERINRHTHRHTDTLVTIIQTSPPREGSDTSAKYLWDFDDRRARLSVKSCTNYARTRGSVHSMNGALFCRAVLTNGHTGHVPRAPDFFFLRAPNWLW